jgi:hypothetical protein
MCTGIKSCMKTGTVRKILSSGAKMKFSLHFLHLPFSSFEIWNKRAAYNALVHKTAGHFECKQWFSKICARYHRVMIANHVL